MRRQETAEPANLVIGGTGMLKGVALRLSTEFQTIVIARQVRKLYELSREAKTVGGAISAWRFDYSAPRAADRIVDVLRHRSLDCRKVVLWVHSHAEEFAVGLLQRLAERHSEAAIVHVLGSASLQPEGIADRMVANNVVGSLPNYRQAVLGFKVEANTTRWLTHAEICTGVLHALEMTERRHVVGTVEPWGSRPGA